MTELNIATTIRKDVEKEIFKKFKNDSKEDLIRFLIDTMIECDQEIISALGNGAKFPMAAYYNGVVVKFKQLLKVRTIANKLLPGHSFMKQMEKEVRGWQLFQEREKRSIGGKSSIKYQEKEVDSS